MVNHSNRSKRDPANRLGLVRIAIRSLKEARDALRAARCPNAALCVTRAIASAEGAERFLAAAGDGLDDLVLKSTAQIERAATRARIWDTHKRRWCNATLLQVAAINDDGLATAWKVKLDNGSTGVYGRAHLELLP